MSVDQLVPVAAITIEFTASTEGVTRLLGSHGGNGEEENDDGFE